MTYNPDWESFANDEPQTCPMWGCQATVTGGDFYLARSLEEMHAKHPTPNWMKVTRGKRKGQTVMP